MQKDKFRPDLDNLDKDWLDIPDQIAGEAHRVARLEAKLNRAEREERGLLNRIKKELRLTPELHGFQKKPADTTIKELAEGNSKVWKAGNVVLRLKAKIGKAKADLQGFLEKRRSLENLVVLHGQGYIQSQPRDKTGAARGMIRDKAEQEVDKAVNKKKKRRDE